MHQIVPANPLQEISLRMRLKEHQNPKSLIHTVEFLEAAAATVKWKQAKCLWIEDMKERAYNGLQRPYSGEPDRSLRMCQDSPALLINEKEQGTCQCVLWDSLCVFKYLCMYFSLIYKTY
jgi:hypothetical protein